MNDKFYEYLRELSEVRFLVCSWDLHYLARPVSLELLGSEGVC